MAKHYLAKKKIVKTDSTDKIPIGVTCKILRPNLWYGFHCTVEEHLPEYHLCRAFRFDTSSFLIAARREELEPIPGSSQ